MFISLAAYLKLSSLHSWNLETNDALHLRLIANFVGIARSLILHTGHGKCFIQMNMSLMGYNATHVCSVKPMHTTE